MSENVSPTVPQLKKLARIELLKQELPQGSTIGEISLLCGVDERTVYRDMKWWLSTGGFEEWLNTAFFKAYSRAEQMDDMELFKVLARLKEKTLTQKVEQKIEGGQELKITVVDEVAGDHLETPPRTEATPQKQSPL